MDNGDIILRVRQVLEKLGFSRTTLYRRRKSGDFPDALLLGSEEDARILGWKEKDIQEWLDKRPKA